MALAMALMVQESQGACPATDLSVCTPAAEADVQPTETCCTNLVPYVNSATPEVCLCDAFLNADNENLDLLYALQIPQKCSLQFPEGVTCL